MALWVYAYLLWAPSASVGLLAYATARRVGEGAVTPVAVAAATSACIIGGAHFEDVLLTAALIAACSGSQDRRRGVSADQADRRRAWRLPMSCGSAGATRGSCWPSSAALLWCWPRSRWRLRGSSTEPR